MSPCWGHPWCEVPQVSSLHTFKQLRSDPAARHKLNFYLKTTSEAALENIGSQDTSGTVQIQSQKESFVLEGLEAALSLPHSVKKMVPGGVLAITRDDGHV